MPRAARQDAATIAGMFDAIAGALRPAQHVLSRRASIATGGAARFVAAADRAARRVLDVCTGTADVALGAARAGRRRARASASTSPARCWRTGSTRSAAAGLTARRARSCAAMRCACRWPTRRVDAVTSRSASATSSVTGGGVPRDGARAPARAAALAILEFGVPRLPGLAPLYRVVFHARPAAHRPRWSRGTRGAIRYLPASVGAFPCGQRVRRIC